MDTDITGEIYSLNAFENPFKSFWMAGYECADHLNCFGDRVDLIRTTGHLQCIERDYKDIKQFNITTVREGICWSQVEKRPYEYDWTTVKYMLQKGKAMGIQQVWDLCHFGFPDDLTPLHPMFARRFAALCRAFVNFYRSINPNETLIVTPINEVSFLSWLGGDARGTSPYCIFQGWEVKYHLMKAYIEGVAALREADPGIRILTTEPLMNFVSRFGSEQWELDNAAGHNEAQFQAVDILCGRMCPELGGKPEYLDILGYNYYYNNQRVTGFEECLPWANEEEDPRFLPLSKLLTDAYYRYNRPIAITETSHPEEDRPKWIRSIGTECAQVIKQGIPLWGVCLYPIIDRPDWDFLDVWHKAGLWDAELVTGELPKRVLYEPYAEALKDAQDVVSDAFKKAQAKVA